MKNEYSGRLQTGRMTAIMALLISLMSLFVSLSGIFNKSLYEDLLQVGSITQTLIIGSRGQDIVFAPLALLLAVFSILYLFNHNYKIFITILGLTGNFLYGYALYAFQGQYTTLYLMYILILGLSIYCLIYGFTSFESDFIKTTFLSKSIRIAISVFLFFIIIMLGPIWIARIIPDITRHTPQETYGVFVLDLGIIFPAIAITVSMLLRNKAFGNILAGVILFKAFTICLSWGFAEVYSRLNGVISGNYEMVAIPGILSVISLVFYVVYIQKLNVTQIVLDR